MVNSSSIIISNANTASEIIDFLNVRSAQRTLNTLMLRNLPIYVYDKNYRTNMLVYRNQNMGYHRFSMRRTCNILDHRCRISFQQFVRTYTLTTGQFIDILLLNEDKMNMFKSDLNSLVHKLINRGYEKQLPIDHVMSDLLDELDD